MKIISFLRKNTILVVVLLLLLVCLLVCGYLPTLAELSRFKNQINKLEFSQQGYEETIAENGARIVEQEQLILSQKDAIALKVLEIDDLKKISRLLEAPLSLFVARIAVGMVLEGQLAVGLL